MERSRNPFLLLLLLFRLLAIVGLTAAILPFIIVVRLGSKKLPHRFARFWARCVLVVLGIRLSVHGDDREWTGPAVIIVNHLGYLDIPVLLAATGGQFRFIADRPIFSVPLLGQAMRLAGYLPIWPSGHKRIKRTLDRAAALVRAGISIAIFPEGGINRSDDEARLCRVQFGFRRIADDAGCPVRQITLFGTGAAQRSLCRVRQRAGAWIHGEDLALPRHDEREDREKVHAAINARNAAAYESLRQELVGGKGQHVADRRRA